MIDTNKIVPDGFILLQTQNGAPKYAACMTGRLAGWLMKKYPDGNWVSERKLTNLEIMQAEDQRDDGIVHEAPAATIQEPVMVAEPTDNADQAASFMRPIGPFEWREFAGSVYAAMRAFDGTWGKSSNEMRRKSLEDKAKRLMRARTDAAPMVADPAGVAGPWVVRERRDKETGKLLDCFVEAPKEGNMAYALEVLGDDYSGYGNVERKLEYCKLIVSSVNASLAATVKAVPSEALEGACTACAGKGCGHCDGMGLEPRKVVGYAECRCILKQYCDGQCRPIFAAPLADKTGGGE